MRGSAARLDGECQRAASRRDPAAPRWSTARRPWRPSSPPTAGRPRRPTTSGTRCPACGGGTLFITSTPASFSWENTSVAVPPPGMSPGHGPHVRRREHLLSGRRSVGAGRRAYPDTERAEPDGEYRGRRQNRCAPTRSHAWTAVGAPGRRRRWPAAGRASGQAARRPSPRRSRPSSRARRAPLRRTPRPPPAARRRSAARCRRVRPRSVACSAYGVASAIRSGVSRFSHASPRHLRSPRMASRIRDLMVARLADSRSETWT